MIENGRLGTNIQAKRENFKKFMELVQNQFEHGGIKYKGTHSGREFTDLICDAFPGESGVDWVLGTIMKYLGRFKNFKREKDLLKVATYCYIIWLKFGFHLEEVHDEDVFIRDPDGGCEAGERYVDMPTGQITCQEQCKFPDDDDQVSQLMKPSTERCVPRHTKPENEGGF